MKNQARVVIVGGGVGGLSAALELLQRGFEVELFDAGEIFGGKVRSWGAPHSALEGFDPLPAEHGFHFFPMFYKHMPDTMSRIPVSGPGKTVAGSLQAGTQELLARTTYDPIVAPAGQPTTREEWLVALRSLWEIQKGIPPRDEMFFAARIWRFMASCDERRLAEYDRISWWDFVEAERRSAEYQKLIARMPSRLLLAVKPKMASARTLGNAMIQMMSCALRPGLTLDRSLEGPTQEHWVGPWVERCRALGGALHTESRCTGVTFDERGVSSVTIHRRGEVREVTGDHFVFAVPVEVMRRLVRHCPEIARRAPSLAHVQKIHTDWMTGFQVFLRRPYPVVRGHVAYDDSAWALTSVSQAQFWPRFEWARVGDGSTREVFSVIVSDWDTPGTESTTKIARHCTAEEVVRESMLQIFKHLKRAGRDPIGPEDVTGWSVDKDITFPRGEGGTNANQEPLMISTVGAWAYRPESVTEVPNMFLASDYVRNTMDFASAEGTNEAARKAVNGILRATGSDAEPCALFPRYEIPMFLPLQAIDRWRFARGKPFLGLPFSIA